MTYLSRLAPTAAVCMVALLTGPDRVAAECPSTPEAVVESFVSSLTDPVALDELLSPDFRSESWAPAGNQTTLPVSAGREATIATARKMSQSGATITGRYEPGFAMNRTSTPGEWILEDVAVHIQIDHKEGAPVTLDRVSTFRIRQLEDGCFQIVEQVIRVE